MPESKRIFWKNGLVQKLVSAFIGGLIILAITALTAFPDIQRNDEAIQRNVEDINGIEVQLSRIVEEMATREDLNRLDDNLKAYIKDLIKNNGGQ